MAVLGIILCNTNTHRYAKITRGVRDGLRDILKIFFFNVIDTFQNTVLLDKHWIYFL